MLITHDRGFMDKLVTHTVGIHRKKTRKIQGNTEKYYDRIAQDEEIYEKTRLNDERRAKEIRLFISRFRAKARLANMVQSRVKTLAKMEKKDKLEQAKSLEFSFRSKPFKAKQVLHRRGSLLCLGAGRPLFRGSGVFHSGRGANLRRGQERQGQDHPAQGAGRDPAPGDGQDHL
jgi:ATP-binding cassette subfamily F protein 3